MAETSGAAEDPSTTIQSERYRYTTGGDPNLLHTRLLGSGGFGGVHEVKTSVIHTHW
jgi:hypothetical protein